MPCWKQYAERHTLQLYALEAATLGARGYNPLSQVLDVAHRLSDDCGVQRGGNPNLNP